MITRQDLELVRDEVGYWEQQIAERPDDAMAHAGLMVARDLLRDTRLAVARRNITEACRILGGKIR